MEGEVVPVTVFHVGDQSTVALWDARPPVGVVAVWQQGGDADHLSTVGLTHAVAVLVARELSAEHRGADNKDGGHTRQGGNGNQALADQPVLPRGGSGTRETTLASRNMVFLCG